mmetsp:Transcript_15297/g.36338  ORF Transcript_15297/g.36338 Transcript_15297/m.36338 type:complete len:362 (+) Transcript_15297:1245-2330(+)
MASALRLTSLTESRMTAWSSTMRFSPSDRPLSRYTDNAANASSSINSTAKARPSRVRMRSQRVGLRGKAGGMFMRQRPVVAPASRGAPAGQQQARGGDIGGAGHVMHIAGPDQGIDVGFVGLRGHRVTQEDDAVQVTGRQPRADLQVTAQRAAEHALDHEAMGGGEPGTGGAGGHQRAAAQQGQIVAGQGNHGVLLAVVGDQCKLHVGAGSRVRRVGTLHARRGAKREELGRSARGGGPVTNLYPGGAAAASFGAAAAFAEINGALNAAQGCRLTRSCSSRLGRPAASVLLSVPLAGAAMPLPPLRATVCQRCIGRSSVDWISTSPSSTSKARRTGALPPGQVGVTLKRCTAWRSPWRGPA